MAGKYSRSENRLNGNSYYPSRLKSVRDLFGSCEVDGMLFNSLENIRYLSGFTGSDGAVVVTGQRSLFLTDSRYWAQAEGEIKGSEIVHYRKKLDGVASLLSDLNLKHIGFESPSLTVAFHRALKDKLGTEVGLVPLEDEIKNLRAPKDPGELDLMRKAIDIASGAFDHALTISREGVLERDIALEMEFFMKRNGAESLAFDIIVASGPRAALPHGKASNKRLNRGDLILFDYGAKFNGYHSDETCTVICGSPTAEQRKIYQVVKDAHDRAIETVRPGIAIHEVDRAARNYIKECGYGDYFGHGLGHGVGLAVHEDPPINGENKGVVQEGMVFTIEPGIYIPDWGGVRIEDMVRVTPKGAEVLTRQPKESREI
jgi:Xaa-Pro aminopeptidase